MAANSAIRMGKLSRCCIETIQKNSTPDVEAKVIQCPHCATRMVFTNNAYQWFSNAPKEI
jgi:hypothetical protein